jgi:hypothetical protein
MNMADTEQKSASGAVVASTANTHLSGSWLIIARTVWLALVVPTLGLFVISLPGYYQQLQTACSIGTACGKLFGALPAQGLQTLSTTGLSASGYAALFTIFSVIIAAIWCAVGFIIFWRRSDDWLALLAAYFLVMSSITPSSGNATYLLALAHPVFSLPFSLSGFVGQISLFVFFLLFPNGRFVPRWMGLILLLVIINAFLNNFPSIASPFETNWPGWLNLLVNLVLFVAIIYSQIYRYRRISTPVQRQQTKWIVLGVTAAIGFYIGLLVIDFLIPSLQNPNSLGEVIGSKISVIILAVAFFLIPLSIGFAILRYRLYDIDIIIHRTLVYSTLTVVLALIYEVSVFTLQYLTSGLALIRGNQLAIIASTLLIGLLFKPLHDRTHALIDRRFYRRKYDAARTIATFSATIRDEVDLNQLCTKLTAVVQETMQPAQVSLWLCAPKRYLEETTPALPIIDKEAGL